jgi:uncharacterized membrane protein YhaH (DUF805 family)
MKGQIANFSPQHGQGIIMGEDGKNYLFISQQWQHASAPAVGAKVLFSVDSQGHAIQVQSLPPDMTSFNLSKASSNNPYTVAQGLGHGLINNSSAITDEEHYGFFDWVKKCLQNYANFNGRARRKEYWYFYLASMLATLLGLVVDAMLGLDTPVFYMLASLGLLVPGIAAGVRRLHDIHKSGWWMLIALIPIVGGIVLLVWYCTDTKPESNQWGAPARRI